MLPKPKGRRRGAYPLSPRSHEIPIQTRVGVFILEMSPKGLRRVRFPSKSPAPVSGLCSVSLSVLGRNLGLPLDLSGCTSFQRKVYAALRKVPAGKTVTYGELAKRAGYPGAARAVGTAMKLNCLPIVIPCHRVIRSDGSLGLYSQGIEWKRTLLACEGR